MTYVWDLSQTSGQPLPARATIGLPTGEVPPGLWDALCWLARREGFAVEREPGCPDDGTTLWTARRIRVPPGLAGGQAIWALAHQLGHVLLHDPTATVPGTTTTGCQGVRKAEADSVAFITCVRHGVPDRARLLQPADLGRHRSAGPARCRHPGRRRTHHHGGGENQPPPGPPPARQHRRPASTCPSRNGRADRSRRSARLVP